ncbi:MAG: 3D domain-containing protein [Candidatus Hydrogenedentes bacterium]|nr:3D domain-containing protein [Candidatus Hydrogenedentota bacterium]
MRYFALLALSALILLPGCASSKPKMSGPAVVRELLTTGYCKCGRCCNWTHSTFLKKTVFKEGPNKGKPKKVGQTASGKMAKKHHTIAADTSLYPFGTVMYIPGYGYGVVEDRGGAIKGQHIDLFFGSHEAALKWGKQRKKVQIWFP